MKLMNHRLIARQVAALFMLLVLCVVRPASAQQPVTSEGGAGGGGSFAQQVDFKTLGAIAVQHEGRIRSFDSHAAQVMQQIYGSHLDTTSYAYTYVDMMLRPSRYSSAPIYVKNKAVREQIANVLMSNPMFASDAFSAEQRRADIIETGLVSRQYLQTPEALTLLEKLSNNLMRTAREVNKIEVAQALTHHMRLLEMWRIIPPSKDKGDAGTPWISPGMLSGAVDDPPPTLNNNDYERIASAWTDFHLGWEMQDAELVNGALADLTTVLPQVNPDVYPQASRLQWESWYFRWKNLTWVWVLYGLAAVPLLLSVVFRWRGAARLGVAMFLGAFALQSFAMGLRWYVAQRWPNSNMFEAITTAAWFGGCAALLLELFVRRTSMRSLFVLGSAIASMVAFMCVYYLPLDLSANIGNMMPVLHDVWLYIHTNVIIFSYCLIFMAAVTAALYLINRCVLAFRGGGGVNEYARVGGAASLIMVGGDGNSYIEKPKTTLGQVLDGTTMVLMELSFVLLWAGIVMGAIWADHSWGRPWGWDPKEVFALNTFIVFAVLIHTRLRVRDKGLWTAILALIGAIVMIFNWVVINFVVVGLHSYA